MDVSEISMKNHLVLAKAPILFNVSAKKCLNTAENNLYN